MAKRRPTVFVTKGEQQYKIFKLWFGRDGSYYVTVPYHPAKTAFLTKYTARYDIPFGAMRLTGESDVLDTAVLDDDESRLKLSHHPDGFCQFSGHGVASGKNADGTIRGVGVYGPALRAIRPDFGPVFSVVICGIEEFEQGVPKANDVTFDFASYAPAVVADKPIDYEDELTAKVVKEGMAI